MQRQNNYRNGNRDWRRTSSNYNENRYNNPGYASSDYNEGYNGSHRYSRRNYGSGGGNYGDRSDRNFFERAGDRIRDTWNDWTDRDRNDFRDNRNRGNYSDYNDREKNYSSRNYSGRNHNNNDNAFKRAGRKIRDTWNDWAYGDYDRDTNRNYRNNFNEYDSDNVGYQGRNSSDYGSRRYTNNDYYNPSDNYSSGSRGRSYEYNDYASGHSPNRSRRGSSDYGYYESYPRYGNSSRYADQNTRPYHNRVDHDDEYNGRSSRNTGWSNAYTPMSEY